MKKSRFWQEFHCWGTELHCSRHRNLCTEHQRHFELGSRQAIPLDTLQIRKTPWRGVTKQPPAVPLPGPNVTPEPNEKSRVWQAIVPGTQNKPQDTLQIRKTPWHGVTKQPPAVPLPGPNVTPEPNEKIKGLAGNCSRHTKQATRHPSNQENTLARRDETASCRPSARAKGSGRQLFQAHKTSHKTPFKSGKHPGTA